MLTCSLGQRQGGSHAPTRELPDPVAVVTGASQGLGLRARRGAGGRRLGARASTPAGPTASTTAVGRLAERPPVSSRWRATSPTPPTAHALVDAAASSAPSDLVVNNASTLGASPLPALDRTSTPRSCARTFAVNVVAPLALIAGAARRAWPTARPIVEHHLRRRGRGLRGLGRLRRVEGRARARQPGPRRRAAASYGCSSSTPATCAPRCTRTRSPARTSPTGPPADERSRPPRPDRRRRQPSGRYEARAVAPAASRQP